jgi:hypothetical protein
VTPLRRHAIVVALMVTSYSPSPGLALQFQPTDVGRLGKPENVNAVIHWNRIATEMFPIEPGPIVASRAFAMLHAAVHSAVNGLERRYAPSTRQRLVDGTPSESAE